MRLQLPMAIWGCVVWAATSWGCIAYNDDCALFVTNPDQNAGWIDGDIHITRKDVRLHDSAIGQMVAEAFFHAFDDMNIPLDRRPTIAIQNSGSIRAEGVCRPREVLKKGPVQRKVLREVLTFNEKIYVFTVTHRQLKNILEHSIARLSVAGTADPKGYFLQLYGIRFEANCNKSSESMNDGIRSREGSRVTAIYLLQPDGTEKKVTSPPSDSETVRLATSEYLALGNDDFIDLKEIDLESDDVIAAGGFTFDIISRYFAKTYSESNPLPAQAVSRSILTDCL